MAIIALKSGEGPLRAMDMSEHANVPLFYLQKVLRRMVKGGLLVSERGHGGGFRLSRPADQISFNDVLDALELKRTPASCVFGWKVCSSETPCVLHHRWNALKDQFNDWSQQTTLEDVKSDVIRMSQMWTGTPVPPRAIRKRGKAKPSSQKVIGETKRARR